MVNKTLLPPQRTPSEQSSPCKKGVFPVGTGFAEVLPEPMAWESLRFARSATGLGGFEADH